MHYLPGGVSNWIVVIEAEAHEKLAGSLLPLLEVQEVLVLGVTSPERVASVASRWMDQADVGLMCFVLAGIEVRYEMDYRSALKLYAAWPTSHVRLCLDVSDDNFAQIFSEHPEEVRRRSHGIAAKVMGESGLHYRPRDPTELDGLDFDCEGSTWVTYSGFEEYDYCLPSGEVACLPRSVDGRVRVDGWLVGTIPFGMKYGRIRGRDLLLDFRRGEIVAVSGGNATLCADVEMTLDRIAGLRSVGELGIGLSLAVRNAANISAVGCFGHERHLGIHLGLGAELAENSQVQDRVTGHHIDIVLASGLLFGQMRNLVLNW
jgi:leucyl aminopeptidase (aminopeptidase T)